MDLWSVTAVRVRVGALFSAEIAAWGERVRRLCEQLPGGTVYVLWATDHEDQPIINANNLATAAHDVMFDWRSFIREQR